jgi:hypothetical protein
MAAVTHRVTWGEALVVEAHRHRHAGGLQAAVARIHDEVGPHIGTRNTFAKLYEVTHPRRLGERDRWRAWLVLTAFGQDPTEWGITDDCVPSAVSITALKRRLPLRSYSACNTAGEVAA